MKHPDNKSPFIGDKSYRIAARSTPKTRLSSRVIAIAAIAPMLSMVGCASKSERHFTVGSVKDNYKTRHPIVIDEKETTLDVPVGSSSFALPIASQSAIEGFASGYRRSTNGAVTILLPAGSKNETAARTVASKVVETLQRSGVASHRIRTATYFAGNHGRGAPIRLSYQSIKASVQGCGQWPTDLADTNSENTNYHNFGCATQNNLAAIIANPADLLGPRGMSDIDATRRNAVIEAYREGEIELQDPPETVFERSN